MFQKNKKCIFLLHRLNPEDNPLITEEIMHMHGFKKQLDKPMEGKGNSSIANRHQGFSSG